jgi:hypothetical protein
MAGRWVDVAEAARELGISTDAVRKRIARGSLESDRPAGNVLVWLDDGGTEAGREANGEGGAALVEVLRSQVEMLRSELAEAHAANRENRRIIAALTQRIPELEAPSEAPGEPESAAAAPDRGDVPQEQETAAERPWWRRIFGA